MEAKPNQTLRIIDANLNRIGEGLRVLEDLARLLLNDVELSRQLKNMRHEMVRGDWSLQQQFLQSRDSEGDVGINLKASGEDKQRELAETVVANARRVQEALRVIEELGILPAVGSHVLTNVFRRLQRRWTYPERIPESILFDFFRAYAGQRFTREVAAEILTKLAHNADSGLDAALAGVPLRKKMTDSQCDAEVHPLLVPENELLSSVVRTKAESIAMGLAMPHVRGLTTGKEVLASVRRFLSALEVRCGN